MLLDITVYWMFNTRCRTVPGPEFVRLLERLWGPRWGDVHTAEEAERAMKVGLLFEPRAVAQGAMSGIAEPRPSFSARPPVCDSYEAGERVSVWGPGREGDALPAGTVLREGTAPMTFHEGPTCSHTVSFAIGDKDITANVALAQARALLQRARSTVGFIDATTGPLLVEIDAFLAGLPVTSKKPSSDEMRIELVRKDGRWRLPGWGAMVGAEDQAGRVIVADDVARAAMQEALKTAPTVTSEDAEDVRRAKAARAESGERMPLEQYRPPQRPRVGPWVGSGAGRRIRVDGNGLEIGEVWEAQGWRGRARRSFETSVAFLDPMLTEANARAKVDAVLRESFDLIDEAPSAPDARAVCGALSLERRGDLQCALPRAHAGEHNTAADRSGDAFPWARR